MTTTNRLPVAPALPDPQIFGYMTPTNRPQYFGYGYYVPDFKIAAHSCPLGLEVNQVTCGNMNKCPLGVKKDIIECPLGTTYCPISQTCQVNESISNQ